MKTSHLTISHLSVTTKEDKEILHDVSLSFSSSKVYAIMGSNGSGKSTLAHALMGNSAYNVQGNIVFNRKNIEKLLTEERARRGLFLSYQSPVAIPGVSVMQLLRTAYHFEKCMALIQFYVKVLHIDHALLTRSIHDGFSGGERKKIELLQALVLKPVFVIFDEIDTGLDVDALKIVAHGINILKKDGTGVIMITHYKRLLSYIPVDVVYVLSKGTLVKTGNRGLVSVIERKGYAGL